MDQTLFIHKTTQEHDWQLPPSDGQLTLDVFRQGEMLIVRTAVAGILPKNLDIALHNDLLTIRGERKALNQEASMINEDDWVYHECYWGSFSRSIVLPVDVYSERAEATIKDGLLEIRLPIREPSHHFRIKPVDIHSS